MHGLTFQVPAVRGHITCSDSQRPTDTTGKKAENVKRWRSCSSGQFNPDQMFCDSSPVVKLVRNLLDFAFVYLCFWILCWIATLPCLPHCSCFLMPSQFLFHVDCGCVRNHPLITIVHQIGSMPLCSVWMFWELFYTLCNALIASHNAMWKVVYSNIPSCIALVAGETRGLRAAGAARHVNTSRAANHGKQVYFYI